MEEFSGKAERLRRIFRGEESYGKGSSTRQAKQYRLEQMMGDIVEHAKKISDETHEIDVLISLSGFSPETTILAFEIINPRKVIVINSLKTAESIDIIADHLCGKSGLKYSDFSHRRCEPTDPLAIYEIVNDELEPFRTSSENGPRAVIDITGGKKVMSATAALAAWRLNLSLCYIDSEYDDEIQMPVPGTERLIWIANPAVHFGDQDMETAAKLFNSGRYDNACEQYAELSRRISKPVFARFMRELSGLYKVWCDLDLERLSTAVKSVGIDLDDPRIRENLDAEHLARIRHQLDFLDRLRKRDHMTILINFYMLGLHYRNMGRHDFAAMLFYRTIEGCLVHRVEDRFEGFDCKKPDYSHIGNDEAFILNRFKETADEAGLPYEIDELPKHFLGYMNSAVLLQALDDPLLAALKEVGIDKTVTRLHDLSKIRNNSILAHGSQTVTEGQCQEIEFLAFTMLGAYIRLAKGSDDMNRFRNKLKFIQIPTVDTGSRTVRKAHRAGV